MENIYCIVNPDDKRLLENECNGAFVEELKKTGGSIENILTPYEFTEKRNQGLIRFEKNESVKEGDIIILSKKLITTPLGKETGVYTILYDKENLQDAFSAKVVAIERIAYLLGCSDFHAIQKISYSRNVSTGINADNHMHLNLPVEEGSIDVTKDTIGQLEGKFYVEANGEIGLSSQGRGSLSQESYNEACKIATEHNLNETQIGNLLKLRDPAKSTLITQTHYTINLSSVFVGCLKMSGGFKTSLSNVIGTELNLAANISDEIYKTYTFEFDAKFPNEQEKGTENTNQQQQADTDTSDINSLKTNLAILAGNVTEHTESIGKIREQIQSISSKIEQDCTEALDAQRQQIDTCTSDVNSLKTAFGTLTGNVTTHTEDIGKIREEIQTVSSKIKQDCTEALDAQRQQIDTCTSDVNSLKTALVTLTGNVTTHTEDIGKIREEMQTVSSKIKQDCTEALDAQRQQIDTCTSEINSLKTHFDYLKENVTVQQKNIDTIREKIQYIERVNTDCLGQLKSQKEQVDILASEIKSLRGSVVDIEKRMEVLRVQYDNQITQVKQQFDRMISQICTSQKEFDKQIKSQKVVFSILISVVGIISVVSLVLSLVFYYI